MASYDPKRPRPGAGEPEEPAPVEALLSPEPLQSSGPLESGEPSDQPALHEERGADDVEVDLRTVVANGSGPRVARDVPVAPAPEQGTANRALLTAAAVAGAAALMLVVATLLRRRRRRSD